MTDAARFDPIFPAHAIERSSITISFDQELPSKSYQRALDAVAPVLRGAGLEPSGSSIGVTIDAATGRITQAKGVGPTNFLSPDRATNLFVSSNLLRLQTGRYVRWEPFIGLFEEIAVPLVSSYAESVSVIGVQLDYLDRFVWSGDWSNFEWRRLLAIESGLVAARASASTRHWHSHSGWFEAAPHGLRRLVNVNIDVVDSLRPDEEMPRPSIGILTLMRDHIPAETGQPVSGSIDPGLVNAILSDLHDDLKKLFATTILSDMSARIGLEED